MIAKSVNEALILIDEYFRETNQLHNPLLVNVNNPESYIDIKNHLNDKLEVIRISDYCGKKDDVIPDIATFFYEMRNTSGNKLIIGISQHLKIMGEQDLELGIKNLIAISNKKAKIVVLCYNIEQRLQSMVECDLRLNRQILFISGKVLDTCKILFLSNEFKDIDNVSIIPGYSAYLKKFEEYCINNAKVSTVLSNREFINPMVDIEKANSGYSLFEILCGDVSKNLSQELGSQQQWTDLCKKLGRENLGEYLTGVFGDLSKLEKNFFQWKDWDEHVRWLLLIALKLNGTKNAYLSYVVSKVKKYSEFLLQIYCGILDYKFEDKGFNKNYDERKQIVKYIDDVSSINYFCEMVKIKLNKKIFYLTDLTLLEKEEVIDWLSRLENINKDTERVLAKVYPDLASYLQYYNFKNDGFNEYFDKYKKQKVNNKIYDGFIDVVNEYARTRPYNKLLQTRNEVFEKIDKTDSLIYFIDALGVEFLGYICSICSSLGLSVDIKVTKANIPTTTFTNKGFLDGFKPQDIKTLDELKHSGEKDYNFEITKLPLHIPMELEIIKDIFIKIKAKLSKVSKVIVVSDHGASRLVVLNDNKYTFDVESNGTQGGRCCKYIDGMPSVEYATIENGQYVLASYDRFKTKGAPRVETHGGATLEELMVPIIEVTNTRDKITATVVDEVIEVSFKVKAELKIFVTKKFDKITIRMANKDYESSFFDGNFFTVPIHDIKKPGKYVASVYNGDNCIDEINFSIKKIASNDNDLGI